MNGTQQGISTFKTHVADNAIGNPDPRDIEATEAYRFEKEDSQRRDYYESRGIDPDSPYADLVAESAGEDGPW